MLYSMNKKEVSRKFFEMLGFEALCEAQGVQVFCMVWLKSPEKLLSLVNLQKAWNQTKQPPRVRCEDLQTKDKEGWDKMALMAGQDQQLLIQREGSLDRPCHSISRSIQGTMWIKGPVIIPHSPQIQCHTNLLCHLAFVTLFCSGYYYIHFIDEVSKS